VAMVAFVIFISMTVYDMRLIRVHRKVLHFRRQPYVSIVIDDMVTDASLKSVSSNDYRKYEIIFAGEPVQGDIVLELKHDAVLAHSAIRQAVQQLHDLPHCHFVEIKPVILSPDNLREFFHLYERVVMAPLISVRAQLDIRPFSHSPWSVVRYAALVYTWRSYAYQFVVWTLALANAFILLYLTYLGAVLNQPELLLLYIAAFALWTIVSLWDYPHFSTKEKILYTFLAPVSFGYFLIIALFEPFRFMSKITNKFFSRSIHQTVA
jgi:hypothetical protein